MPNLLFSDGFCRDFTAAITGPCSGSWLAKLAHLKPSTFIRLLAAGNLTVVEGRFLANCLLYGLEIFVAVLYNATTINPTTELVFRFIKALRADPQWKSG